MRTYRLVKDNIGASKSQGVTQGVYSRSANIYSIYTGLFWGTLIPESSKSIICVNSPNLQTFQCVLGNKPQGTSVYFPHITLMFLNVMSLEMYNHI